MKRRNAAKGLTTGANGTVSQHNGAYTHQQASPTSPKRPSTIQSKIPVKSKTNRTSSVTHEAPKPRDGHVALSLANNMFVFGGDRY